MTNAQHPVEQTDAQTIVNSLTDEQQCYYRIALLHIQEILVNENKGCEDLDDRTTEAAITTIHEYYNELFTLKFG